MLDVRDRYLGCLLGLAVGDALGAQVEFERPGSFQPLTGFGLRGPHDLGPGQWTDDTSMALCLASSLVERRGLDAADQAAKYLRWYRDGWMSPTGECFDIGNATRAALQRFERTGEPVAPAGESVQGNGALMRLAPVPMAWAGTGLAAAMAAESSAVTHNSSASREACSAFAVVVEAALEGRGKRDVLLAASGMQLQFHLEKVLAGASYAAGPVRGSGHVVMCLEAALWAFWSTSSYRDCVLAAANLGGDADTTAAVAGQLAGAFYGSSGIPAEWLELLWGRELVEGLAVQLLELNAELRG